MKNFLLKFKKFHNLRILLAIITLTLLPTNKIYPMDSDSEAKARRDAENRRQTADTGKCELNFEELHKMQSELQKIKTIEDILNFYLNYTSKENVHTFDYYFINTALEKLLSLISQIKSNELLELIKECVKKIEETSNLNLTQKHTKLFKTTLKKITKQKEEIKKQKEEIKKNPVIQLDSTILGIFDNTVTLENFNLKKIYKILKQVITPKTFVKTIDKLTNLVNNEVKTANQLSLQKLSLFNIALLSHITTKKLFSRTKLKFISGSSFLDYNYFSRLQAVIELFNSLINVYLIEKEEHKEGTATILQTQMSMLKNLIENELKILPKRIKQLSKEYVPSTCNWLSRSINAFDTQIKNGFNYIGIETDEINPLIINKPISDFIICLEKSALVKNEIFKTEETIFKNILNTAITCYYDPTKAALMENEKATFPIIYSIQDKYNKPINEDEDPEIELEAQ